MPYDANKNELDIFKFWKENNIFEKSIESRSENKPYAFYDGPPFATGLPHYGHIVAGLMKDVVPRFWTMNGYRVERRWGWDCHGLPIENIIEKEMGFNGRKDIVDFGVDKFNESCRATVLKYAEEWKTVVGRMGRWVDMENDYKTMDRDFMESVWWVFSELWKKDLIYEGHKAMHICPRCCTPLSNFEVTQGYKDVKDISVTAKFKVKNSEKFALDADLSILAWTTTPWTLPGNVLLAVGSDIDYVFVKFENEYFVAARDLVGTAFEEKQYEVVREIKGSELVGLEYEPLFPYFAHTENAFRVVSADFVTTSDGTGIVHIAPAFGEDDYNVGLRENIALLQHVKMDGTFVSEVTNFAGQEVKPKDDPTKIDVEIIKWLAGAGKLFAKKKFEHSYPHCWRCDTPLLNYATSCWFVKVTHMKDDLLVNNEKTNWIPDHVKDGRFGKWLEGVRDWAISRNRFWGTPLPVWRCENEKCETVKIFGSVESLETACGKTVDDLHKHIVDELSFACAECGGRMKRIPEVLDCWFESGAMPYGQMHYPFENKEKFEATFPAQFIAEGQDQTRGWFYTLHVLATALTRGENPSIPVRATPAFQNVIVNGIVLAEDGKKMSKKLKNYPDPTLMLEKYGADAVRYYLVSSPVMHAENLNFSEAGVREVFNKLINTLSNCFEFYKMFANKKSLPKELNFEKLHILDQWILSKLQLLVKEVTENTKAYKLAEASRPIVEFVTELSQWYVRRSRDRFKGDDESDKENALATLREVFLTLSKIMAPFTPFIAEQMYREVSDEGGENQSVHLETWPEMRGEFLSETVLKDMELARKFVEMGLSLRSEAKVKVRQPLSTFLVFGVSLAQETKEMIADELNVKEVVDFSSGAGEWLEKIDGDMKVSLNIEVTESLKREGSVREIVRSINQVRKESGLTVQDTIEIYWHSEDETIVSLLQEFSLQIGKSVLAKFNKLDNLSLMSEEFTKIEVVIDEKTLLLFFKKVS
jgi:isoleucyl-tRNA synthetase